MSLSRFLYSYVNPDCPETIAPFTRHPETSYPVFGTALNKTFLPSVTVDPLAIAAPSTSAVKLPFIGLENVTLNNLGSAGFTVT